ncbi:MAG: hypothetical protein ACI82Z_000985 [Cellvibrionaceae bacterium]|jgi:hypothetical protein
MKKAMFQKALLRICLSLALGYAVLAVVPPAEHEQTLALKAVNVDQCCTDKADGFDDFDDSVQEPGFQRFDSQINAACYAQLLRLPILRFESYFIRAPPVFV